MIVFTTIWIKLNYDLIHNDNHNKERNVYLKLSYILYNSEQDTSSERNWCDLVVPLRFSLLKMGEEGFSQLRLNTNT